MFFFPTLCSGGLAAPTHPLCFHSKVVFVYRAEVVILLLHTLFVVLLLGNRKYPLPKGRVIRVSRLTFAQNGQ